MFSHMNIVHDTKQIRNSAALPNSNGVACVECVQMDTMVIKQIFSSSTFEKNIIENYNNLC